MGEEKTLRRREWREKEAREDEEQLRVKYELLVERTPSGESRGQLHHVFVGPTSHHLAASLAADK